MRVLEWKNKRITEADLFVDLNEEDLEMLAPLFPELRDACEFFMGYHVFVNTEKKTIIPLRHYFYAFGNQYNGYFPYGKVLDDITLDFSELSWQPYAECESDTGENKSDW